MILTGPYYACQLNNLWQAYTPIRHFLGALCLFSPLGAHSTENDHKGQYRLNKSLSDLSEIGVSKECLLSFRFLPCWEIDLLTR